METTVLMAFETQAVLKLSIGDSVIRAESIGSLFFFLPFLDPAS